MSKAGQNTFTGISVQADVSLMFLLESCKRTDLNKIIVEGDKWEDFSLIFNEHNEHFEVKWHSRAITYADIKKIIEKELVKTYGEKDRLKIIVKNLSAEFRRDFEYLKRYLWWLPKKDHRNDPIIKRFSNKNWPINNIYFLLRSEIFELKEYDYIYRRLVEYFAFKDPFYLSHYDLESIVARSFRTIMLKSSQGASITRQEFMTTLGDFKKSIAQKSESFSPEVSILNKVEKLSSFFKSEDLFAKLNHPKYLSPISDKSRLIFYITDKIEQSDFHVQSFEFFIKKILLKNDYVRLVLRLLENKWEQKKVENKYLLNFLFDNYSRLTGVFNFGETLRLLVKIAKKDVIGEHDPKILNFLKSEVLAPIIKDETEKSKQRLHGEDIEEQRCVVSLIEFFYNRSTDKDELIKFILEHFDFTEDLHPYVVNTHPNIYQLVKEYVKSDFEHHFDSVIKKICNQFSLKHRGKYQGYEWSGSGISQSGSNYSISDLGVSRNLFGPLFSEMYTEKPNQSWELFKHKILDKSSGKITKKNPLFLRRSLVTIILGRLSDDGLNKSEKEEALQYLEAIVLIKKGFPGTSEIVFDQLRRRDLAKVGFKSVLTLIHLDSEKYTSREFSEGYPTNLFVISTLLNLVKGNYQPAKEYFLELIKKPDFFERDQWYDSFELLSSIGVAEADPEFIIRILKKIDIEEYLNKLTRSDIWYKSGILTDLIKMDWQSGKSRGVELITELLKPKNPSQLVLEFLSSPIRDLAQEQPLKTYQLFENYLRSKQTFQEKFKYNKYVRQNFVWLAQELAKNSHYDQARQIIELCIYDPDPITNNTEEDFNYHLQVKKGEGTTTISTVRGTLPWVLKYFAASNQAELMKYSLEKVEILLDLDGKLCKKLGYSEPDYYVRLQALIALIEIAKRREVLNSFQNGLGDYVKALSFRVLDNLINTIKTSNARPTSIVNILVNIFSYIRDLTTNEARKTLNFFEEQKEADAYFLFIYFAIYREKQFKSKPFQSKYFKEKLTDICLSKNVFRQKIAWYFWRIVEDKSGKNKRNFDVIEEYWSLLFEVYEEDIFRDLYHVLEHTLCWPEKYQSHKELLKKAIKKETEFFKNLREPKHLWTVKKEIFEILKTSSVNDFLDCCDFLIRSISFNDNINYFVMPDILKMFHLIKPSSLTKNERDLYSKVKSELKERYPEKFIP